MLRFRLHILANSSKAQCYVTMKLGTRARGKNNNMWARQRERQSNSVSRVHRKVLYANSKLLAQMFPTMEIRLRLNVSLFVTPLSSNPTCTNLSLLSKTKSSLLSFIYRIMSFSGNTNDRVVKLQWSCQKEVNFKEC